MLDTVFIGDMGDMRIDLSIGNNKENFLKCVLLSLAQFKLTHSNDCIHNSLTMEILLNLMPEIEKTALLLADNDIITILQNKSEFEKKLLANADTDNDIEENEAETFENDKIAGRCPTEKELKIIDKFSEKLSDNIDMKKFEQLLVKSLKYYAIYKRTERISEIKDKTIANIILNHRQNYKTEY